MSTQPPSDHEASIENIEHRVARIRPYLEKRDWPPMTYMLIPSLLSDADSLIAELEAYRGAHAPRVAELLAQLKLLRKDFRRES